MMIRKTIYNFIPSFSSMTFIYCFFVLTISLRIDFLIEVSFISLTIFTFISSIANTVLALKPRPLGIIASVNIFLLIVFEVAVMITPMSSTGVFVKIAMGIIVASAVIAPLVFSLSIFTSNKALIFVETSILGSTFFFFAQFGTFTAPLIANVACVVAIILNLYLLSSLRIERTRKENLSNSYMRGFIIVSIIAIVVAVSSALALAFVPSVRSGIIAALVAIRNFFVFLGEKILQFMGYIISLFPVPDGEYVPIEFETAEGVDAESTETAIINVNLDAILLIAGVVIIALIAFVIFRFRKKKIKFESIYESVEKESIDRTESKNLLIILLKKLIRKIAFIKSWALRKSTYEGAFITICHFASKRGLKRSIDETPREYLHRIANHVFDEKGEISDDTDEIKNTVLSVFDSIMTKIDAHIFALNGDKYVQMNHEEISELHRFIKGLKGVPKVARN